MYPFGYSYVIEMDDYTRTVTLHRADTACRPPRPSFLGRLLARWSGNYREPSLWTPRISKDAALSTINNLNESIIKAFGGIVPPYKFKECHCAR